MNLKDTAMARAFARGLLVLSEKQTAETGNALLAVQRVDTRQLSSADSAILAL